MMKNKISLESVNNIENKKFSPVYDWLKPINLETNEYIIGFWIIRIQIGDNGQRNLKLKGVSKVGLMDVLASYGFRKRYRENQTYFFIHEEDSIIKIVTPAIIKDFAVEMLNSLPEIVKVGDLSITSTKLKEAFTRSMHVLFGDKALSDIPVHSKEILSDSAHEMFFPFMNIIVKVTADCIELLNYSDLEGVNIWYDHIIDRPFFLSDVRSVFEDFIENVSGGNQDRYSSVRAAIGYCLHRYYNATNTRAVILYDEQITDAESANGGTGKGIFAQALSYLRTMETVDGKKFDSKDKFCLQRITEATQIVFIDDISPNFDFERFNSILTNGWEIEAKHTQSFRIPVKSSPKMVIASNFIMKTKDGNTIERRQFIIEFSDFYSRLKTLTTAPIVYIHGNEFFYSWDMEEWSAFDNYMIRSCQHYLKNGLPITNPINVRFNRLLQETSSEFVDWVVEQGFENNVYYSVFENYKIFKETFYLDSPFHIQTFSQWMKLYAKAKGIDYITKRIKNISNFCFKSKE